MLPNSVTVGEKSNSSAIVAALMNFIVIIGVRKTAIPCSFAIASSSGERWNAARDDETGNLLVAERAKAELSLPHREVFEVGMFRRTQNLDALLGEVGEEPGEREAGAVDRRLADAPLEADRFALELQLQRLGVQLEKAADRDHGDVHPLLAPGGDCLHNGFRTHRRKLYRGRGGNSRTVRGADSPNEQFRGPVRHPGAVRYGGGSHRNRSSRCARRSGARACAARPAARP